MENVANDEKQVETYENDENRERIMKHMRMDQDHENG